MDSQAIWVRLKTHRWVYSFSIVATLTLGILIGTVVSSGVKGKEGQKVFRCDATLGPRAAAAFQCVFANR